MERISDEELITELKRRFEDNERALHDLRVMTRKLEHVNRKLQESETMKSNFLSNIRNEMNNPLTAIMGLAQRLMEGAAVDAEAVASLIFAESFDLDFQLKNIFAAAELEAGEAVVSLSNVDVRGLADKVVSSLAHRSAAKKLDLEVDCRYPDPSREDLFFRTDPEKLHLILVNLLANAVEFSREGQRVLVRVALEEGALMISVQDFGAGLREEERSAIFDRFHQLESGSVKSHRGHGLGLSVTKSLLDLLEGSLSVTSEEGKGSEFLVTVPEAAGGGDVLSEEANEFIFEEKGEETF
jgi:signal transduction histidine kinase